MNEMMVCRGGGLGLCWVVLEAAGGGGRGREGCGAVVRGGGVVVHVVQCVQDIGPFDARGTTAIVVGRGVGRGIGARGRGGGRGGVGDGSGGEGVVRGCGGGQKEEKEEDAAR